MSKTTLTTVYDTAREFSQYFHSLDVWHKSKKLKKCLAEVSTMHKINIIRGQNYSLP